MRALTCHFDQSHPWWGLDMRVHNPTINIGVPGRVDRGVACDTETGEVIKQNRFV